MQMQPTSRPVKAIVYSEMVAFEETLKDENEKNDLCRNGLKMRHHPEKFRKEFGSGIVDFEVELK